MKRKYRDFSFMADQKTGVSLADVAQKAAVDPSTASRALAGDLNHRISEKTRKRVIEAARLLGYRPNPLARGLRTARSNLLGIIVPQLDNPVYAQMIMGAEAAVREAGYALLIMHVGEDESSMDAIDRLIGTSRVDGLLFSSLDDDVSLAPVLKHAGVPSVVLNRRVEGVSNCVSLDTYRASKTAMEYLIKLGHTRIAHLAGRPGAAGAKDRMKGYRDALRTAGLKFDSNLVATAGYTAEGGEKAMDEVLRKAKNLPTAVFPVTLQAAAGALKALRAHKLAVPRDMSIVTLHDSIMAEVLDPPITTVRLPAQRMGYVAAKGLIDLIEGRVQQVFSVLEPLELVTRSSAVPPR